MRSYIRNSKHIYFFINNINDWSDIEFIKIINKEEKFNNEGYDEILVNVIGLENRSITYAITMNRPGPLYFLGEVDVFMDTGSWVEIIIKLNEQIKLDLKE